MLDLMLISTSKTLFRSSQDRHKQRGQTLVEFAFVCLLFLTLLFGIVEFSRALWTWNTIVQATRAGARFAVVEVPTPTDDQVKNFVVYYNAAGGGNPVLPGLTTSNVSVQYVKNSGKVCPDNSLPDPCADKYAADAIHVSITGYTFNFLLPVVGSNLTLPSFTTTLPLEGLGAI
jgi:Flp pilus assembly protein TadG